MYLRLLPTPRRYGSWAAGKDARNALAQQGHGLAWRWLVHGDDENIGGFFSGAHVGVGRAGVEVDRVAGLEGALIVAVAEVELALKHVEEFEAGVHVRARLVILLKRDELGEVGVHVPVGNQVAEALKKVGRLVDAGLRQAHTLLAPVDAEHGLRLTFEKI